MNKTTSVDTKKQLHDRGICVIIPTYNNENTIKDVVLQCSEYCQDIIIVNDGCTDRTQTILDAIPGITVVAYKKNKGKGYALKTGIKKALSLGFSYAITIDADGQHYPKEITLFLNANISNPGSLIIGCRNLEGKKRSAGSVFANKFSNFWFFVETLKYLPDTQTGYRLYPIRKMKGLNFLTSRYEAELELLVFSAWHGIRLIPIFIEVYYPKKEERVSHFKPFLDFTRISLLNTLLCAMAIIYALPLCIFRLLYSICRNIYSGFFFAFFSLFVLTPLVLLYSNIGKMSKKKKENLHKIIYHIARFVMLKHGIPGTKFDYKNTNPNLGKKPSVIICNHQSHLDLMCQLIFTPKIIFLTNDWVWHNPFYGSLIRKADYLPVSQGIETLLPSLKNLANDGYSIAVFPEGTRSADLKLARFHQGAFYIAQQLNLDIIPMYLYGTGNVLRKKKHLLRKGKMYIEVGESITSEELATMGDLKSQASKIHKLYQSKLYELNNNIEKSL